MPFFELMLPHRAAVKTRGDTAGEPGILQFKTGHESCSLQSLAKLRTCLERRGGHLFPLLPSCFLGSLLSSVRRR
jgi:hypothetical protein